MSKHVIYSSQAPAAIGTYSQAVRSGHLVFLSGQIGLEPETMQLVDGIESQIEQVLNNLTAVITASGGQLDQLIRLTVYLTDLTHFELVNRALQKKLSAPYPARAVVGVAQLPRGALVEIDGIVDLTP